MNLAAVIVTHNSASVLETCCRSVRSLLPSAEIIVVDNASTDDTQHLCRRLDGVRLIANSVNVGYGRACNQGAEAAGRSHVLFLNPDVEIVAVDERGLHEQASATPFGLVAPRLQWNARGTRTVRHWTFDLFTHVFKPLWPRELPEPPSLVKRGNDWWPAGALLLVDRAEFLGLGGFDPRFFLYYEDLDLARRYRAADLSIRTTAALRGRHRGGTSSAGDGASSALRDGWSYLSWIEYLYTWNGRETAVRAAKSASLLRRQVYLVLGLLTRVGPASGRARRKRLELVELEHFVRARSASPNGSAADGFCPEARAIVSAIPGLAK
jgi:GT2 family glycosyltransferase